MKYEKLDPVLHQSLRLSVVSILISLEKVDFNYLRQKTDTTQGNLSHQLKTLSNAGYINIEKTFERNYPKTYCILTVKGKEAFAKYVKQMKQYLNL